MVHVDRYGMRRARAKGAQPLHSYVGRDVDLAAESALKDFELEDKFADRFLAGQVSLTEFPYYDSYVRTIDAESTLIGRPRRILFIGSGPVPLSAILYARKFPEARVDIVDIDKAALKKGAKVAKKAGTPLGKQIAGDAATIKGLSNYDVVVVALEVGPTDATKRAVLEGMFADAAPRTTVLLRGSRDVPSGGMLFVNTRRLLPSNTTIVGAVPTFDGYSETFAVRTWGR